MQPPDSRQKPDFSAVGSVIPHMEKRLDQIFHKRRHPNADKHMKWSLISLVIREMQTKTTRHHFVPIKTANIKKTDNTKYW